MPSTLTFGDESGLLQLRGRLTPPLSHRLRTASRPAWLYRPCRLPAGSPPPPHPCPDPPHARPCAPDASARPSSSRCAHPHPSGSSTPYSTCASSASGPAAPAPPASASPSPTPSPDRSGTPRNSLPCPAARSSASPPRLPASSHRCRLACPSTVPIRQQPQHPAEHFAVRLHIDQPPRPRDRRVIRRRLRQTNAHKLPQRQRVRQPPRDPSLAVDSLEVADQQRSKVNPGTSPGRPIFSA